MSERNENRPGYKKTKVGWIPEEWKVLSFDKILDRIKVPVKVEPKEEYQEIGIRSHGKGIFHKDKIIGAYLGNKSVFWVKSPALIFNIVFAWEQAVAVSTDRQNGMIASHRFPMYESKRGNGNLYYVYRYFLTKRGKHHLGIASPGGAGRNKTLSQSGLKCLPIPFPPIPEQKKITEVLSTWDTVIEQTRRLVGAKKTTQESPNAATAYRKKPDRKI